MTLRLLTNLHVSVSPYSVFPQSQINHAIALLMITKSLSLFPEQESVLCLLLKYVSVPNPIILSKRKTGWKRSC